MMRVGDCDRERIGGVGAGDLHAGKQAHDHRVDLRLLGIAVADHRFLDQPRGIFADRDPGAGGDHDGHPARLAELERRLRVLVDEHFLDRGGVGPLLGQQRFERIGQCRKALGKRRGAVGLDLPVGDVAEAIALGRDQAPAGGSEARVEAEDFQSLLPASGARGEGNRSRSEWWRGPAPRQTPPPRSIERGPPFAPGRHGFLAPARRRRMRVLRTLVEGWWRSAIR